MKLNDLGGGDQDGANGRALATSCLSRLLIQFPQGSLALVFKPQTLAHRSIHPLTWPAFPSVDVLKLKNNYRCCLFESVQKEKMMLL